MLLLFCCTICTFSSLNLISKVLNNKIDNRPLLEHAKADAISAIVFAIITLIISLF